MQITKKEIIQKLYEIEEKEDIKLGREVQKVIRNELVPTDVIKLINKYDKNFLKIYDTYNTIYMSRNKNPLFRNLKNKNLSIEEKAVAISSFITKILISCTKIQDDTERQMYCKTMDIGSALNGLTMYATTSNPSGLLEYFNQVNELINILYLD